MKTKIAILGSTGSIGINTFDVIKKNRDKFDIVLLTTNRNINKIFKQVKIFKVKNIIITSKKHFLKAKNKNKNKNLKIYNNFKQLNKIFNKKIDYTMCAITGLAGLQPTISLIKHTKVIAIANKESIICGWNLLKPKLNKFKTKFIPVDSEHFSLWKLINENNKDNIEKIYITASGGPFLKWPLGKIKNVKPKEAINHPNWPMGKKISVDSATMINKVFEIIEAKKIFGIDIKKFEILIHPKSYIHAIVKFKNGIIKFVAHDTDMKIPIANSIYYKENLSIKNTKLNLKVLNNLKFAKPDNKRYPAIKLLKNLTYLDTLFETALISANDELVKQYLDGKIKYNEINIKLNKILRIKNIKKYYKKKNFSFNQIDEFKKIVTIKTINLCKK